MIKKFHNKNQQELKFKVNNLDTLNSKLLSSLSTIKHFNKALNAGCKVLIVDKNNNLVEIDQFRNEKIICKLDNPDYTIDEIKSIFKKRNSSFKIKKSST